MNSSNTVPRSETHPAVGTAAAWVLASAYISFQRRSFDLPEGLDDCYHSLIEKMANAASEAMRRSREELYDELADLIGAELDELQSPAGSDSPPAGGLAGAIKRMPFTDPTILKEPTDRINKGNDEYD
jgi:hypothetical protein